MNLYDLYHERVQKLSTNIRVPTLQYNKVRRFDFDYPFPVVCNIRKYSGQIALFSVCIPHPAVSAIIAILCLGALFRCRIATTPVASSSSSVARVVRFRFITTVRFLWLLLLLLFFVRCLLLESIIWLQMAQETSKVCFGLEIH